MGGPEEVSGNLKAGICTFSARSEDLQGPGNLACDGAFSAGILVFSCPAFFLRMSAGPRLSRKSMSVFLSEQTPAFACISMLSWGSTEVAWFPRRP
jgi:hypothetical protein